MGRFCKSNKTYFLVKYESVIRNWITSHIGVLARNCRFLTSERERERVSLFKYFLCLNNTVLAATGKKKKMQKEMSSSGDVTSVAQDDAIEIL
jgi:hypothetical protein